MARTHSQAGSSRSERAPGESRITPRRRSATVLFALSLLVTLAFAAQAQAATYTVGTTTDATGPCPPDSGTCSLRQLIDAENGQAAAPTEPDTIVVPAGTYDLTNGPLVVAQSMNIAGAGARTTTVDQQTTSETSRVFDIQPTAAALAPNVIISGLTMTGGKADATNGAFGGDVRNQGNLILGEDVIEGGQTTGGSGGGISNDGGTLWLSHSLVRNNTSRADDSGGGLAGGVENYGDDSVGAGTLAIDNSTIAENAATAGGGVVSRCNGETGECSANGATNLTTIIASTIAFNDGGTASPGAGGLLSTQGRLSVANSIVASNTVTDPATGTQTPSDCGSTAPGVITSLGFNLETGTDCGFTGAGDEQSTDPGFLTGHLAFNGGDTETFALSATSPAIDAVPSTALTCLEPDQRLVARPQGSGCDIGAYELFQPVEGQQFTTVVGQVPSRRATIDWGDGTSSAAQVDPTTYDVSGTHTYAEEGIYHATICWTNGDGAKQSTPFDVKVVDAPLSSTPSALQATAGTAFSGPVATFTDADPAATVADYSATVSWGDGTRSTGTIVTGPSGAFEVDGTHTYTTAASYVVAVTVTDAGGAMTIAHDEATVKVAPPAVTAVAPPAGPTAGATNVTLTGTDFTNASAVEFGSLAATSFTVEGPTKILAVAPAQSAGTVDVQVTTPAGTSAAIAADQYSYQAPPTVQITAPGDNQTFNLNQTVATAFACAEGAGGPALKSCADSNGATAGAGALDTSAAGPHIYTVTAKSQDGQTNTAALHYTVRAPTPQAANPQSPTVPSPPAVTGGAPTSETSTGAIPSGNVNPEGVPTQAYFQYGLDLSERGPGSDTTFYDQSTMPQTIGADTIDHTVAVPLSGLIPGALYHIRLVAASAAGTTFGQDQTFTTAQAAAPPPPVLGHSEDVTPVSGTVFIRVPGGQFIPLTGATQIPTGSQIDALHGFIQLIAAVGRHRTEHGTFGGAIFRLTQAHTGLSTLSLLENAFTGGPSFALCQIHATAEATASAARSRTLQLLHASAHGSFTTRGRYGAATVRGTKWTIADRCNGTLIHDLTDSVLVHDFVRHRTILLHAGQSYLAPAHPG